MKYSLLLILGLFATQAYAKKNANCDVVVYRVNSGPDSFTTQQFKTNLDYVENEHGGVFAINRLNLSPTESLEIGANVVRGKFYVTSRLIVKDSEGRARVTGKFNDSQEIKDKVGVVVNTVENLDLESDLYNHSEGTKISLIEGAQKGYIPEGSISDVEYSCVYSEE